MNERGQPMPAPEARTDPHRRCLPRRHEQIHTGGACPGGTNRSTPAVPGVWLLGETPAGLISHLTLGWRVVVAVLDSDGGDLPAVGADRVLSAGFVRRCLDRGHESAGPDRGAQDGLVFGKIEVRHTASAELAGVPDRARPVDWQTPSKGVGNCLAQSERSSGATVTPRDCDKVSARPSTWVPTTGTPSPRPSTALCDQASSRDGTTCTALPAI